MLEALQNFQTEFPLLNTILTGAAILLATWVIERIVRRIIMHIGRNDNIDLPAGSIFANIARVALWLFGLIIVAKVCFGYDLTAFIAALGVGGIALSLGLQDTIANLFGGLQITLGRIVDPGDYFYVDNAVARVTDVSWRHTTLVDATGSTYIVPNSVMYKNKLVEAGEFGLVNVPIILDPTTNLDEFTEKVKEALSETFTETLGPLGIRVLMNGMSLGGLSGTVTVDIQRDAYSNAVAANMISRAIDPLLKQYGTKAYSMQ
ncbi:MAG: mechanosensitive ion channel family protein [Eggerthellaceae bacterium]|nr:mechanosensitive ion channel family protein [Eggerthellaceae bacterium]